MQDKETAPFSHLGTHLRALRARNNESLADASGAVEIDVMMLDSIEKGRTKPTEDILLLLISHFQAREDEAVHLWEMAGYGSIGPLKLKPNELQDISYTDSVEAIATNNGVILKFMLNGGDKTKILAKLGMSREHAKKLADAILEALKRTE